MEKPERDAVLWAICLVFAFGTLILAGQHFGYLPQ